MKLKQSSLMAKREKTKARIGKGDTISGLINNGSETATISWTPT